MGKKKGKVDKNHQKKRKTETKKLNPFEIKVNKQKHHILGRKLSKHEIGLPGQSRSKSIKKRNDTLLPEYEHRFKSSQFVDKRIGEKDANLSYEEKMTKRLVLEKQKYLEKRNIFSLNDEEEQLTHYGQTLSEIETFEKPPDSDDEEIDGRISGKMVAEEHFGGGILEKHEENDEDRKPWKERMEELIIKTRKEKFELQKERENAIKLTEQVDSDWKTIRFLMSGSTLKNSIPFKSERPKVDDYDMNVRALGLEARALATDKMKSEEELAKEENEKLEKLEKERQLRMKAPWEAEKKANRKYMSADALGDEQFLIPILKEKSKKDSKKKSVKFAGDDDDEEEEGDDGGSPADDDDDDGGGGDEGEDSEEEEEESESDGDSVEDNYSDVLSDEEEKDDKEKEEEEEEEEGMKKIPKPPENLEENEEIKQKRLTAISEKAKKQLPFTFEAPSNYPNFLSLLDGHSTDDQIVILERIQKCTHPSLAEGNKKKLENLFSFVFQYFLDVCNRSTFDLWLIDRLSIELFQLLKVAPKNSATLVLQKIEECRMKFSKTYPDIDTLLMLKLIPLLFPSSDFQHLVCTPAMLFMGQILSQSSVNSGRDVSAGLFICSIFLQCVSSSKRFVPEVINFLHGILHLSSSSEKSLNAPEIYPPFKLQQAKKFLILSNDEEKDESMEAISPLKLSYLKVSEDNSNHLFNNNHFRLCATNVAVGLIQEFYDLYKTLPSGPEIFSPIDVQLKRLPTSKYPKNLQDRISKLNSEIEALNQTERFPLCQIVKEKITNLKMFEPRIEEVSDYRRKKSAGASAETNERQKLLYKLKKETKGAIREIKKDAQFLARHQRKEQMQKDSYRKRKVKEIFSQMENQEAEFQEMKRTKQKEQKKQR